jgi:uncharacterized protein (DUF1697 family)
MEELRMIFEELQFSNVRTYLQSGNILFDCKQQKTDELTQKIEAVLESAFGYVVRVFVRDGNDFRRIIAANPFLKLEGIDSAGLYLTFLRDAPPSSVLSALQKPGGCTDDFFIIENDIFLHCPDGYGKTKLSNTFFEKKLKIPATTRNWKTVNALFDMATGNGE